ncbi:MAG TPA: hypothetical protein VNR11_04430 [Xanthobacteraceae bacterium]|nr:hypothetical protein [Xanthobacteraceae bacterium]
MTTAFSRWSAAALVTAALVWLPQGAQAQENPLKRLAGSWSGNGTITMNDGTRERIRCRASYRNDGQGGADTDIELRCASDSYKFELSAQVSYSGGHITGNWSESTRGVAGNISGTAKPGRIDVRAIGQTFAALLTITSRSDSQSVSIRSPGSTMQEVAITLARR